MLRHPHLVLVAPSVIRTPYFQTDGVLAARFSDKYAFRRMRDLGARNDHNFLCDTLVDENPIAFAHRYPVVFPAPTGHGAKLSSEIRTGNDFAG